MISLYLFSLLFPEEMTIHIFFYGGIVGLILSWLIFILSRKVLPKDPPSIIREMVFVIIVGFYSLLFCISTVPYIMDFFGRDINGETKMMFILLTHFVGPIQMDYAMISLTAFIRNLYKNKNRR